MSLQSSSFLDLFYGADLVVQTTIIILLILSITSWSIIFNKWFALSKFERSVKEHAARAERNLRLTELYEKCIENKSSLAANLLCQAYENYALGGFYDPNILRQDLETKAELNLQAHEGSLNLLATIGSSSPFIGLFGTVWGIMVSFQEIAAAGNTSIAVVAPGVAEALFATAMGLVAAIPAVIFYNKFITQLNRIGANISSYINIILYRLDK